MFVLCLSHARLMFILYFQFGIIPISYWNDACFMFVSFLFNIHIMNVSSSLPACFKLQAHLMLVSCWCHAFLILRLILVSWLIQAFVMPVYYLFLIILFACLSHACLKFSSCTAYARLMVVTYPLVFSLSRSVWIKFLLFIDWVDC